MMQTAPLYAETPDELIAAVRGADIPGPSLGIIFSSEFLDIGELSKRLGEFPFPIAGCSSSGEILSGRGNNPVSELSATGCLLDPDPDTVRVHLFERGEMSSFQLGTLAGNWGKEQFRDPVFFLLVSGLKNDGEQIVKGIESAFSHPPQVCGACAGDDGAYEQTFVFTNGAYSSDGIVAIVFDRDFMELASLITSGWRSIGIERQVTRSSENTVYTIEGQPALDLYLQYLHLQDEDIPRLSVDFPLIVRRADGTVIIRSPSGIDAKTRALVFSGSVPEGSMVSFSSNSGDETIQNSITDIENFAEKIRDAELMILFSCMARHQAVGSRVVDEINAAIRSGKALLVGFFSYGEIGNNEFGECEFYNETFTLVTLRKRHHQ